MTDSSNEGAMPEAQRSRRTTWLIVAVLVVAVGVVAGLADLSAVPPALEVDLEWRLTVLLGDVGSAVELGFDLGLAFEGFLRRPLGVPPRNRS